MSIVLINQHMNTNNEDTDGTALQAEFTKDGVTSVVVPAGLDVQWLPGVSNKNIAVIKTYDDTKLIKKNAAKLTEDLAKAGISAIVVPINIDIEILPV